MGMYNPLGMYGGRFPLGGDPMDFLIYFCEQAISIAGSMGRTLSKLASLAADSSKREKKNNGKGDWVLTGKKFSDEIEEIGKLLQKTLKLRGELGMSFPNEEDAEKNKEEEAERARMMEEFSALEKLGPKKGIRTKEMYKKYRTIKEYFLKKSLEYEEKLLAMTKQEKDKQLKQLEEEVKEGKLDPEKAGQIRELQEQYDAELNKYQELEKDYKETLADRESRKKEEERLVKEAGQDNKPDENPGRKPEDAAYELDPSDMEKEKEILKKLMDQNVSYQTGNGKVTMNVGSNNLEPELKQDAKNRDMTLKGQDLLDAYKGNERIQSKESYEEFMGVKEYFLKENMKLAKEKMKEIAAGQRKIRESARKQDENVMQLPDEEQKQRANSFSFPGGRIEKDRDKYWRRGRTNVNQLRKEIAAENGGMSKMREQLAKIKTEEMNKKMLKDDQILKPRLGGRRK